MMSRDLEEVLNNMGNKQALNLSVAVNDKKVPWVTLNS